MSTFLVLKIGSSNLSRTRSRSRVCSKESCYIFFQTSRRIILDNIKNSYDREIRFGRCRIDLVISFSERTEYIKDKPWLIGKQKGYHYNPSFYFDDPTSVGVTKEVDKLLELYKPGGKWLLLLLTLNPCKREWEKGLDKFNQKFFLVSSFHTLSQTIFQPIFLWDCNV